MSVNVKIILILAFATGACSSGGYIASIYDDLYRDTVADKKSETEGSSYAVLPGTGTDSIDLTEGYYRDWEYAWQEYNVSPADTIWFENFIVVGADTLSWEEAYGYQTIYDHDYGGYQYDQDEGFYLTLQFAHFHMYIPGLYFGPLFPGSYWYNMFQLYEWPEGYLLWTADDGRRPNYSYYMGLTPRAPGGRWGPPVRVSRSPGRSLISAVRDALGF